MADVKTSIKVNDSDLNKMLEALGPKINTACFMYATTQAIRLEAYMKTHRPWTDRTGMAKAMLNARVSQTSPSTIRLTLAHGVDYGINLELAHGMKYAIVKPTLDKESQKVFNGMQGLLNGIAMKAGKA